MLSIEHCSAILNEKEQKYSKEEVEIIRDALYELGELDYEVFKESENEKSDTVHPRIDRRTS